MSDVENAVSGTASGVEWLLTITREERGGNGQRKVVKHATTADNGHSWNHLEGTMWEFAVPGWSAIVTDVLMFEETREGTPASKHTSA